MLQDLQIDHIKKILSRLIFILRKHSENSLKLSDWKQSLRKLFESRMTFVESSMKALQKQDDFFESSTKAGSGWLSLKAPQKQDDFRWKLYKCRMTFVESSTKALQNRDDFCWKLYESRMTLVESSTKAGWLSLKAPRKLYKSSTTSISNLWNFLFVCFPVPNSTELCLFWSIQQIFIAADIFGRQVEWDGQAPFPDSLCATCPNTGPPTP